MKLNQSWALILIPDGVDGNPRLCAIHSFHETFEQAKRASMEAANKTIGISFALYELHGYSYVELTAQWGDKID
jgi:hypothetical protein